MSEIATPPEATIEPENFWVIDREHNSLFRTNRKIEAVSFANTWQDGCQVIEVCTLPHCEMDVANYDDVGDFVRPEAERFPQITHEDATAGLARLSLAELRDISERASLVPAYAAYLNGSVRSISNNLQGVNAFVESYNRLMNGLGGPAAVLVPGTFIPYLIRD